MTEVQKQFDRLQQAIKELEETPRLGYVTRLVGLAVEADGPQANVGQMVEIRPSGARPIAAKVIGFRGRHLILMPFDELIGVGPGSLVVSFGKAFQVPVSEGLKGRVLDGLGRPLDGGEPVEPSAWMPIDRPPPHPLQRQPITQPISLGVRSIDTLITCGRGQRLGIFAGSGVGKSTLLGMMARGTDADVNVIALIGERGREVREFLERDLGEEGRRRSVVVVATSDQPAMMRLTGAFVATAIAEYFRSLGLNVLFMMDSVTRFAAAQREIGLAAGEPPATKGYPPSVFALLPKLLERTGSDGRGTITGLYTVLVDGDDMNDPIADAIRSILDGHVVLSRRLAERAHFPAVDVMASVSRTMMHIVSSPHQKAASKLRALLSAYSSAEDLISIGAYVQGSDPLVDESLERLPQINTFLTQEVYESTLFAEAVTQLQSVVGEPS